MQVTVRTPVRPTEDPAKVRDALQRFWPDGAVTMPDGVGEAVLHAAGLEALDTLRSRIWELRIIDALRSGLLSGVADDGRSLMFRLSKQAALQGHVAFPPAPHPLGELEVVVRLQDGDPWTDAQRLVWWLCPETEEGRIVGPTEPQ